MAEQVTDSQLYASFNELIKKKNEEKVPLEPQMPSFGDSLKLMPGASILPESIVGTEEQRDALRESRNK